MTFAEAHKLLSPHARRVCVGVDQWSENGKIESTEYTVSAFSKSDCEQTYASTLDAAVTEMLDKLSPTVVSAETVQAQLPTEKAVQS